MVDEFLQSLARLKVGNPLSGHRDPYAGLGVGNFPGRVQASAEAAEIPDLDFVSVRIPGQAEHYSGLKPNRIPG